MIALLIVIPLIAAMLAIAVNKNQRYQKHIAFVASVVSLALFPLVGGGISQINWFSVGGVQLNITTSINPLNSLLLLLVLSIAPLVLAYSIGFMELPSEQKRYYMEMLAFETAMLAFAMAGNFVMLFIAWEFLSLTSYLLIGFWHSRERALAAARKTITIILIEDIALLASIVIFQNAFGTLEFSQIITQAGSTPIPVSAVILLMVAVMTKSAQFPFHEWLTAAMEGPTPVSAFLHSSTMVKAGVFATLVLFPIFSASGLLQFLLPVGAITVALSVFNAMREHHIKRVLAYSTIQELGIMFIAIASNAILAAVYFFLAQSFYKALLFFCAGVSMKANDNEELDSISGIKQNKMIYFTTLFGVLALAGFVPFDGFFANVGLGSAFSTNLIVYSFISLVGLGTSFYIFRWLILQQKPANMRVVLNYGGIPKSMKYSMVALAILTVAASAGFFFLSQELGGSVSQLSPAQGGGQLSVGAYDAVIETAVVLVGAFIAYFVYGRVAKKTAKTVQKRSITDILYTSGLVNAAYLHIAAFVEVLADGFAYFDSRLNSLFDAFGHFAVRSGEKARTIASGNINVYAAVFALGLMLLVVIVQVI